MPTVRTYGTRQVSSTALPGARLTPVDTPEAEGAGLAEARGQAAGIRGRAAQQVAGATEQLAGIGAAFGEREFTRIQEQARRDANESARLKWSNQLADWTTKALYDPQSGVLNRRGEAAFSAPEEVGSAFEQMADEIGDSLATPEQKLAFAKDRAQARQTLNLQVIRHVDGEMQAFKENELKSFVANTTDDAIRNAQDPVVVGQHLANAEDAIRRNAPALGLGPQTVDMQVRATRSSVHVGVINQLLALEQPGKAQAYFDAAKDEIAAGQLDTLEKALEEGGLRAQSQATADRIIRGGGTLTQQLEQAKGLEPKLRDLVEQRLEHNAAIQERAQRDAEEQNMRVAYNLVDKSHDVASIPPALWTSFNGSTRAALYAYADQRTRVGRIETDWPTYYALQQQASDDPTTFMQQNLLNYRHKLDDGEFKQMTELQMRLKKGDQKGADKELAGFRTKDQILTDTLALYGLDAKAKPDTPEGHAIASLRRLLDQRVDAAQADGKKVSNTEVQQALDDLLSQKVTTPGSWWGLLPFSGSSVSDRDKRVIDLTIDDVPANDRTGIEQALRVSGKPVTDATVLETYQNILIRRAYRTGGSTTAVPAPRSPASQSGIGETTLRVLGRGAMGLGRAIDRYEQLNRRYPVPHTNVP